MLYCAQGETPEDNASTKSVGNRSISAQFMPSGQSFGRNIRFFS